MIKRNVSLKPHSHYKIGGSAAYFAEPKTAGEVDRVLTDWRRVSKNFSADKRRIFILGGGTNILFSNSGLAGLVIKPGMDFIRRTKNGIRAGAGISVSDLLVFTAKHSLSGLEWAGGLPGTLGGAIRGNAGAFGGEIKNSIVKVRSIDYTKPNPKIISRNFKECGFGYRDSIFKQLGSEIIVEAELKLKKGDRKIIKKLIDEKIAYRQNRQPLEYPNIGSIFKNIPLQSMMKANKFTEKDARSRFLVKDDPFPVIPTARLISECGLKGRKSGGAMISEKHANFIVNVNHATSGDVKNLIRLIKKKIYRKYNVKPEEEIMYL